MSEINFRELQKAIHLNAMQKGFWDKPITFGDSIALVHSELSEALEEYRKGKSFTEVYYSAKGKPEGIPTELADVVIRVMDMCEHHNINLLDIILEKHEFNKTRGYRHGNKVL